MNVNSLLEKLGFDQFDNNSNTTAYSFDDVSDPILKKELLLIQQVQLYKDFLAEEQLIASYRGQLYKIVAASKAKDVMGYDLAYQYAVSQLKKRIRKYELSRYKLNKPITFFTDGIKQELDKLYKAANAQSTVKMSDDLSRHKTTISNATSILTPQLGRTPTNDEVLNFIQNDMGYAPDLNLKKIERINHYDTREYSGSATIGQENSEGAETLTFEDISNGKSIEDVLENQDKEERVINAIREFTQEKDKRKFLMSYLGLGEFKNAGTKGNAFKASINNGISSYKGKNIISEFREYCVSKGVFK